MARLQAEISCDGVLNLSQFIAFEIVNRFADDVIGVDAAYLVDKESGDLPVDLH